MTSVASKRCVGTTILRAWFTHAPVVAVTAVRDGPANSCANNMMGGSAKRRLTIAVAIAVTTAMTTEIAIIQIKLT